MGEGYEIFFSVLLFLTAGTVPEQPESLFLDHGDVSCPRRDARDIDKKRIPRPGDPDNIHAKSDSPIKKKHLAPPTQVQGKGRGRNGRRGGKKGGGGRKRGRGGGPGEGEKGKGEGKGESEERREGRKAAEEEGKAGRGGGEQTRRRKVTTRVP